MSGLSAIHGFDRQRLILALILAATALYLIAVAPGFRYRRAARTMAVTVYAAALSASARGSCCGSPRPISDAESASERYLKF